MPMAPMQHSPASLCSLASESVAKLQASLFEWDAEQALLAAHQPGLGATMDVCDELGPAAMGRHIPLCACGPPACVAECEGPVSQETCDGCLARQAVVLCTQCLTGSGRLPGALCCLRLNSAWVLPRACIIPRCSVAKLPPALVGEPGRSPRCDDPLRARPPPRMGRSAPLPG